VFVGFIGFMEFIVLIVFIELVELVELVAFNELIIPTNKPIQLNQPPIMRFALFFSPSQTLTFSFSLCAMHLTLCFPTSTLTFPTSHLLFFRLPHL
jgi:hypothetical protein